MITIIIKRVKFKEPKRVTLPPTALLAELKVETGDICNRLVFKGQLLDNDHLALQEVFDCENPVVYCVPPLSKSISPQAIQSTQNSQTPQTNSEPSKTCRICYSPDSSYLDDLFRPCRCKGSVAYVHRSCLNSWRLADNPQAHESCIQCGFRYRVKRNKLADVATSVELLRAICCVVLITIVSFFAILSYISPIDLAEQFHHLIEWTPPNEYVKHFVFGGAVVGLVSFFNYLKEMGEFLVQHGSFESAVGLGIALTANGSRGLRVFAAAGLCSATALLFKTVQRVTRQFVSMHGERVLSMDEELETL